MPNWVDYADHWDYMEGEQLLARIRIDGPPNDVYKDGVYVTTIRFGCKMERVASTDLQYNKEDVEWEYQYWLDGEKHNGKTSSS